MAGGGVVGSTVGVVVVVSVVGCNVGRRDVLEDVFSVFIAVLVVCT